MSAPTKAVPDPTLAGAKQGDIVILIMGASGVGKSSFINNVLAKANNEKRFRVAPSEDITACTVKVESVIVNGLTSGCYDYIRGRNVILVDTPGFDGTVQSDSDMRKEIDDWLKFSSRQGLLLGGYVFLHNITGDRFSGAPSKNFDMFKLVRGAAKPPLGRTVLVTTRWELEDGEALKNWEAWEAELRDKYWCSMLKVVDKDGWRGATMQRLKYNEEGAGALGIINSILSAVDERMPMLLDLKSPFLETDIVILVTGNTGAGRSTFINALIPPNASPKMKVGANGSLTTCTHAVEYTIVDLKHSSTVSKEYRLVIVDTPGFNTPEITDPEVVRRILDWFYVFPQTQENRCGVVYIHDLTEDRPRAIAENDVNLVLGAPLSSALYRQLAIATTKWKLLEPDAAEARFNILKDRWGRVVSQGSEVSAFKEEGDAWTIMRRFLEAVESSSPLALGQMATRSTTNKKSSASMVLYRLLGILGIFGEYFQEGHGRTKA